MVGYQNMDDFVRVELNDGTRRSMRRLFSHVMAYTVLFENICIGMLMILSTIAHKYMSDVSIYGGI